MNIIISNSSPDPIYEQISQQIKDAVVRGELQPGEMLPSIRNLARELRISVITTKALMKNWKETAILRR
jgi:GntR family transcriptional regulator